jgi:hydrogenase maturation protein HypF
MAAAWLAAALEGEPPLPAALAGTVSPADWEAVGRIGRAAELSPLTSSIGRLFDAVGVLCGAPARVSYEGQAAVELEALAWTAGGPAPGGGYRFQRDDASVLDPRAAVSEMARDLERGVPAAVVSARFHSGVAAATVDAVTAIASARGVETAVLSGGVFQNRMLLQAVAASLDRAGLRVLVPERLPPNDGGISFGQAAVAAAQ